MNGHQLEQAMSADAAWRRVVKIQVFLLGLYVFGGRLFRLLAFGAAVAFQNEGLYFSSQIALGHAVQTAFLIACSVIVYWAATSKGLWYWRLGMMILPAVFLDVAVRFRFISRSFVWSYGHYEYLLRFWGWSPLPQFIFEMFVVGAVPFWLTHRRTRFVSAAADADTSDNRLTSRQISLASILFLVGWAGVVLAGLKSSWLSVHILGAIAFGTLMCGYFLQSRRSVFLVCLLIGLAALIGLAMDYGHMFRLDRLKLTYAAFWRFRCVAFLITAAFIVGYVYLALTPVRRALRSPTGDTSSPA